jgi:hypothetical protein
MQGDAAWGTGGCCRVPAQAAPLAAQQPSCSMLHTCVWSLAASHQGHPPHGCHLENNQPFNTSKDTMWRPAQAAGMIACHPPLLSTWTVQAAGLPSKACTCASPPGRKASRAERQACRILKNPWIACCRAGRTRWTLAAQKGNRSPPHTQLCCTRTAHTLPEHTTRCQPHVYACT